ncbi:hypothetical protein [Nonomuraea sediminis]|uniref:hypothetical protein n=1 Tax=Nonomuraea sediminis TaxID=2835864 RepID=UPI001BDBBA2E|nr:hypothetical protein [Nonomuraea sediminis]
MRYGEPYGQQPPPGWGHPPPHQEADKARATAIVALVLNCLAIPSCCNILAIPGAILAGLALGRANGDAAGARRLLVWSWVLFGVGFAVSLGVFLFLGLNGHLDEESS